MWGGTRTQPTGGKKGTENGVKEGREMFSPVWEGGGPSQKGSGKVSRLNGKGGWGMVGS